MLIPLIVSFALYPNPLKSLASSSSLYTTGNEHFLPFDSLQFQWEKLKKKIITTREKKRKNKIKKQKPFTSGKANNWTFQMIIGSGIERKKYTEIDERLLILEYNLSQSTITPYTQLRSVYNFLWLIWKIEREEKSEDGKKRRRK